MPQGDDYILSTNDPTPAETPVDEIPAALVPAPSDDAASAPVEDDTPAPPAPPVETPEQAKARSDRAFASMRRANEAQAARIAALEARLTPTPDPGTPPAASSASAPVSPPQGQAPQPEGYATHAEYVQAVATWAVQQHEQVRQAQTTAASLQTAWAQQETQVKTKFADYDEALAADTTRYHPAVLQAIQTSDQGAEVAYHLATHPEDATRIAALAPMAALRALGRLEAQLSAPAAERRPSPEPEPTPASPRPPRPLAPVGGAGTGGSPVAPDQLPYDEFVGWYKKTYGTR